MAGVPRSVRPRMASTALHRLAVSLRGSGLGSVSPASGLARGSREWPPNGPGSPSAHEESDMDDERAPGDRHTECCADHDPEARGPRPSPQTHAEPDDRQQRADLDDRVAQGLQLGVQRHEDATRHKDEQSRGDQARAEAGRRNDARPPCITISGSVMRHMLPLTSHPSGLTSRARRHERALARRAGPERAELRAPGRSQVRSPCGARPGTRAGALERRAGCARSRADRRYHRVSYRARPALHARSRNPTSRRPPGALVALHDLDQHRTPSRGGCRECTQQSPARRS